MIQKIFKFLRKKSVSNKFQLRHLTLIVVMVFLLIIILSIIQKNTIQRFLESNQAWYQEDSAVQLANLTTTSLEHTFEIIYSADTLSNNDQILYSQVIDKILTQQLLQKNVHKVCLLLINDGKVTAFTEGSDIIGFIVNSKDCDNKNDQYSSAIQLFEDNKRELLESEQIISIEKENSFYTIVPFTPSGEILGGMYMENTPDFTFITDEIINSFDELTIIYSAIIIFSLLVMYYISSYAMKERNVAERESVEQLQKYELEKLAHEKESLFTKRIYHTHHKAEKTVGFIKEDIRELSANNISQIKERIMSYSNFISRIIYDMKWYDPPLNTIINPLFKTNLNDVIRFMVNNIFLRVSSQNDMFKINLDLDETIKIINVNEFVVWEIVEPIIQNSIDHCGNSKVIIEVKTIFNKELNAILLSITDNGKGIKEELLEKAQDGIQKIFCENSSTKDLTGRNSGYGCYISYQLAVAKCGWKMEAENLSPKGCRFNLTIMN